MMNKNEIKSLVLLLDDDDPEVLSHVKNKILEIGNEIIPYLEEEWHQLKSVEHQQRVENIIQQIQFKQLCNDFANWYKTEKHDLLEGVFLVAKYRFPELEMPSEEEVEELMGDMENFNLERAKRRFINSLIQGAAFKGGHMFNLVRDEINEINPQLMNLYAVTQALMEHAYWIFPDMEGMAGSGGGQMGQSEFDPDTDPPTVKARAVTFPLLVHELVKGVYEVFGTHGLPDDPRQAEMVLGAEDSLPAEIWDSRLGPVFWEKFLATYPLELFDDDKKHIQHYLLDRKSTRLNSSHSAKSRMPSSA